MNKRIVKHFLYPIHEWVKKNNTIDVLKDLMISQYYNLDRLQSLQLSKLKRLLSVAAAVPYYRETWKARGFHPNPDFRLTDIEKLPFLNKEIVRNHNRKLVWVDFKGRKIAYQTGGSTGEPMQFIVDNHRVSQEWAANWRARRWWGIDIGDRQVMLWGSPIELTKQDRIRQLRDALFNHKLFSAFNMSEERLAAYVSAMINYKPDYLFGYASSIYLFAKYIDDNSIPINGLSMKAVYTTADMLYDSQRELVEKVFNCQVGIEYGSRDGGFIAHECPKGNMHINAEGVILEIIGDDGKPVGPGEIGEIVITNLDSLSMPFIRYRTGDLGVMSADKCPCGVRLPILDKLYGRVVDHLIDPDNKRIHSEAVTYIMRNVCGVDRFQAVQNARDHIDLKVVKGKGYTQETTAAIHHKLNVLFDGKIRVDIQFLDSIETTPSGKYRYVISNIVD